MNSELQNYLKKICTNIFKKNLKTIFGNYFFFKKIFEKKLKHIFKIFSQQNKNPSLTPSQKISNKGEKIVFTNEDNKISLYGVLIEILSQR